MLRLSRKKWLRDECCSWPESLCGLIPKQLLHTFCSLRPFLFVLNKAENRQRRVFIQGALAQVFLYTMGHTCTCTACLIPFVRSLRCALIQFGWFVVLLCSFLFAWQPCFLKISCTFLCMDSLDVWCMSVANQAICWGPKLEGGTTKMADYRWCIVPQQQQTWNLLGFLEGYVHSLGTLSGTLSLCRFGLTFAFGTALILCGINLTRGCEHSSEILVHTDNNTQLGWVI